MHFDNLAGILAADRLWCDAQSIARGLAHTNIGYGHIKERRLRRPVAVSAGGTLGDYVPFNFCSRSVMLYVVWQGHEGYQGGQREIVHLVSSIGAIRTTGRPWFFTDLHADLGYARQFDSLKHLGKLDWRVMPLQQWGGDQEVKEKRQAEFLVHDWCPWSAIESIGVIGPVMAARVGVVVAASAHRPRVDVRQDWYY